MGAAAAAGRSHEEQEEHTSSHRPQIWCGPLKGHTRMDLFAKHIKLPTEFG
jgi:hypothetical protein